MQRLPAYPAALPGAFNTEIQIQRGFWLVSWFKNEFAHAEQGAGRARRQRRVAVRCADRLGAARRHGPDLQPYWSPGLRDPGPEGKGAIIGFGDVHTRAHVYRALIEGLAYGLRAGRELIEARTRRPITRLVISGGGAQSDGAMQIAADVFGLAAERPQIAEASSLGAAMLCAAGLGWHADVPAAAKAMARPGRRFEPEPRRCAPTTRSIARSTGRSTSGSSRSIGGSARSPAIRPDARCRR